MWQIKVRGDGAATKAAPEEDDPQLVPVNNRQGAVKKTTKKIDVHVKQHTNKQVYCQLQSKLFGG